MSERSQKYKGKFKPDNPSKYMGDVENIIYRSGWERRAMKYFDTDYYGWCDIGYFRTDNAKDWPHYHMTIDKTKIYYGLVNKQIFNQIDTYIDDRDHKKREFKINKKTYNKNIANNSLSLYEDELSHCDKDILKALSVKQILPWTKENAIYWDEKLLHCSNNFKTKGIKSKQHIIIHTYTENKNELV